MKGKDVFTKSEIEALKTLILLRNNANASKQKGIRQKMRDIGFFGKDDWGITDLQLDDLTNLIKWGKVTIVDNNDDKEKEPTPMTQLTVNSNGIKKNKTKSQKDETYVLDICDKVLRCRSSRQHKFDFLFGDKNKKGSARKLPVDGFYESHKLVIEYRERQHTESVAHFDKPQKLTINGEHRGEQRKKYDEKRRKLIPDNGLHYVEISYFDFKHNSQKRIIRNEPNDTLIIERILKSYTI